MNKLDDQLIDTMIQHSFKDFHVKGFDYLCVKRTENHTRKFYFFDGDVSQLPDVVNPHDHRYDFMTTVITGEMSNSEYLLSDSGRVYNEFEYRTPLLGGDGFTFNREVRLREIRRSFYVPGEQYFMEAREFHTIRMHRPGTIIMLDQYADTVPVAKPTKTFMQERQAPSLDGLYAKFTADEAIARFRQIEEVYNRIK